MADDDEAEYERVVPYGFNWACCDIYVCVGVATGLGAGAGLGVALADGW